MQGRAPSRGVGVDSGRWRPPTPRRSGALWGSLLPRSCREGPKESDGSSGPSANTQEPGTHCGRSEGQVTLQAEETVRCGN